MANAYHLPKLVRFEMLKARGKFSGSLFLSY